MSTTRLAGVLLAFAGMVVAVPAWAAPGSTDQIKARFDEAMSQPLAERVGSLQELDEKMGQALAEVTSVKERAYIHKLRYRSRRGLGRYEAAHQSFAEFASAMRRWDEQRAQRAVPEFVQKRLSPGQRGEVVALADAALASWAGHDQAAPALLYLKAKALSRMANRAGEALPVLERAVSQYPESAYHPRSLRLMGHLQANGYGDGDEAALKTLKVIERQYAGTWWEQYAHMKPAVIFEKRQGDPQKALERYRETLDKFPSHKYGPFIRRQINRLQGVIEKQLIDDALKGVRGDEPRANPRQSLAHYSGELMGFEVTEAHRTVSLRRE